jgi:peptidoglycan glycosyltransferase
VNRQIGHLFTVIVILFALLVGATTWWTTVRADDLANQTIDGQRVNQRPLLEQQQIPRGLIYAADGSRLAANVKHGSGQTRFYTRRYPQGTVFANPVGYAFTQSGTAGLERYYNDDLAGRRNEFASLLDQLLGEKREGKDLHTNLDPAASKLALSELQRVVPAGAFGSVVALVPGTGQVRVMVSTPSYDPNKVPDETRRGVAPGAKRDNRATMHPTPPGSTFKVVTAAAAIDSGKYSPDSMISGKNGKKISGVPLMNDGGEDFGLITLTDALTHSVNTVFGEVAEKLGDGTMFKYMRRFGFESKPPVDLPSGELDASGVYRHKKRLLEDGEGVDIGRVGIGQSGDTGEILATPLQMAEVAATVANDGVRMKPRIGDRLVRPDGRLADKIGSEQAARVISSDTAQKLTVMMKQVVHEGTGTQAALVGIDVAGKTGTAEIPNSAQNPARFIAFAPATDPQIAIAVTVPPANGQGGTVAAPIARDVMKQLLGSKAGG